MQILEVAVVIIALTTIVNSQTICRTPNDEQAQCKSIYDCQIFLDVLKDRTPDVERFIKESQCGYTSVPLVCCGSVARYQNLNSPTTTPARLEESISSSDPRTHRNYNLLPPVGKCGVQTFNDKLIGGNVTSLDEFPWLALLEYRKNGEKTGYHCGGMLINDGYVLTAAHCVVGGIVPNFGNLFRVRLGEYDISTENDCIPYEGEEDCADPVVDVEVEDWVVHPNYNATNANQYNDIALVRLSRPISTTDFITSICLPINTRTISPRDYLYASGWGRTETGMKSAIKLKVQLPYVEESQCREIYKSLVQISSNQLCAGGLAGTDSCANDNGGPLVSSTALPGRNIWYVEGVASFGPRVCGIRGFPGVYTKVSNYVNWILDNMKPFPKA